MVVLEGSGTYTNEDVERTGWGRQRERVKEK